jgi:hypothetical protein
VLRRIEAEEAILTEHAETDGCCAVCADLAAGRALAWPCPTVLGLARAWRWPPETEAENGAQAEAETAGETDLPRG